MEGLAVDFRVVAALRARDFRVPAAFRPAAALFGDLRAADLRLDFRVDFRAVDLRAADLRVDFRAVDLRAADLRVDFRAVDLRVDFRAVDLRAADLRAADLRVDFRAVDLRVDFRVVAALRARDFRVAAAFRPAAALFGDLRAADFLAAIVIPSSGAHSCWRLSNLNRSEWRQTFLHLADSISTEQMLRSYR
jgi:hypothetical protein